MSYQNNASPVVEPDISREGRQNLPVAIKIGLGCSFAAGMGFASLPSGYS
jgi:hypothetical protein